ncbi:FMN-binding protein, partial [Sphaerisporangium melleum]
GLVLLLSFKPHAITTAADRPAAVAQNGGGSGGTALSGDRSAPASGGDDEGEHDDDDDDEGALPPATRPSTAPSRQGGTGGTGGSGTSGGRTVTGDVADTRWGPVQVALVLSGRKITAVQVLQSPHGNRRDLVINERALPILEQEALSAQSAQIDTVSGATYTSDGYVQSLQSALDRAGL